MAEITRQPHNKRPSIRRRLGSASKISALPSTLTRPLLAYKAVFQTNTQRVYGYWFGCSMDQPLPNMATIYLEYSCPLSKPRLHDSPVHPHSVSTRFDTDFPKYGWREDLGSGQQNGRKWGKYFRRNGFYFRMGEATTQNGASGFTPIRRNGKSRIRKVCLVEMPTGRTATS